MPQIARSACRFPMRNYHLQNLPERIEKLRRHIKSRRGRRDFIALGTLVDISETLKGRKPSTTTRSLDAMLKAYYDAERSFLEDCVKRASQPFFPMIKADPACPPDRAYFVPLSSFLPEPVEDDAVKARCPDCDELVPISPNGKDPAKTNKRQRIDMHPDKRELAPPGEICPGSGKDV